VIIRVQERGFMNELISSRNKQAYRVVVCSSSRSILYICIYVACLFVSKIRFMTSLSLKTIISTLFLAIMYNNST
jgi:hypothetical protein